MLILIFYYFCRDLQVAEDDDGEKPSTSQQNEEPMDEDKDDEFNFKDYDEEGEKIKLKSL